VEFDRLLITTGVRSRPWPNPIEAALDGVFVLRTRDDAGRTGGLPYVTVAERGPAVRDGWVQQVPTARRDPGTNPCEAPVTGPLTCTSNTPPPPTTGYPTPRPAPGPANAPASKPTDRTGHGHLGWLAWQRRWVSPETLVR
jgi:hypothetical protein